jgi:hypothetical protein
MPFHLYSFRWRFCSIIFLSLTWSPLTRNLSRPTDFSLLQGSLPMNRTPIHVGVTCTECRSRAADYVTVCLWTTTLAETPQNARQVFCNPMRRIDVTSQGPLSRAEEDIKKRTAGGSTEIRTAPIQTFPDYFRHLSYGVSPADFG